MKPQSVVIVFVRLFWMDCVSVLVVFKYPCFHLKNNMGESNGATRLCAIQKGPCVELLPYKQEVEGDQNSRVNGSDERSQIPKFILHNERCFPARSPIA